MHAVSTAATFDTVRVWSEEAVIPTYPVGAPNKNPFFLEKRVYQGSSGVVYPYPVIEEVAGEKEDRTYTAVYLENRWIKLMVLPEIGGRVQMALDKTNGYHFVYYNRVVKPALVGLAGPWISGGIEFNWPQHHRPTTFMPTCWRIEEHADGSKTVWCGEVERMFNTTGVHGFTLYPDRAYFDVRVLLYNNTAEPQTFLWWANPAVHVNDDYQSVFPTDVTAVMDHGKRAVSSFPIATGEYYKVNYAPGTDISRYKNIPVPTSYMAAHSDYDFLGCYDHGAQAGMLHVANHHIVPGKKQWTWGCGDFGQAWDRRLTDEDGPYIELMCGAYTDNQPDFSWLQPGEEKSFTQTFMPYKRVGAVKNATVEAAVNLEIGGGLAAIGVYVTRPRAVRAELLLDGHPLWLWRGALSPDTALVEQTPLPSGVEPPRLALRVLDEGGRTLVAYRPQPPAPAGAPLPATAARPPQEIESVEELYLNGLHLEQYRHATYAPEPYYAEALRRDPGDSRCNTAMGLLLLRRGRFAEAEPYFRRAVARLTLRNPNPYDGEPLYHLGMCLVWQGRDAEAFDALYKAAWNGAWQDAAFFVLARLAARAGRHDEALALAERSLARNAHQRQAAHLRMALLRRLGRRDEARAAVERALVHDPLEFGALYELDLLDGQPPAAGAFARYAAGASAAYTQVALDYAHAGLWQDATALLAATPPGEPLAGYYLGWVREQAGDAAGAAQARAAAAAEPFDFTFPNRLEAVLALESALAARPGDARAHFALGNFWYGHRRHAEAITAWEACARHAPTFPTVHRNLGLAYFNARGDAGAAAAAYARAFALDPTDARVLFELDQLAKRRNAAPAERLALLEQHAALVAARDDLTVERISLLNALGRPDEALALLTERTFHPWEGGEGKVTGQYVLALVELARRCLAQGDHQSALDHLQRARTYPPNLGEGKLAGAQEQDVLYYMGCAYAGLGDQARAAGCWRQAAAGESKPASAMYYNDQPPDMLFYQGLARRALGRTEEAGHLFHSLVDYGQAHNDDPVEMDYFAVSLPEFAVFDLDLTLRHRTHCAYMQALGHLGLGAAEQAEQQFAATLALDANHVGALVHRRLLAPSPGRQRLRPSDRGER